MGGPSNPSTIYAKGSDGGFYPVAVDPATGQLIVQLAANPTIDIGEVQLLGNANGDVGKTNVRHFNVAGNTLIRPANTTAYSANDSVSDNATAGSVTANTVTVSDTNDDPVDITEILLDSSDTGFAGATLRIHIFNSDPTANSGVQAGDNVAWSNKRAGWVGSFSGTMVGFSDGCKGTLVSDGSPVRIANVESGGKRLWWQIQTLSAATPSANSTTFTPRFKGYQGRA